MDDLVFQDAIAGRVRDVVPTVSPMARTRRKGATDSKNDGFDLDDQ